MVLYTKNSGKGNDHNNKWMDDYGDQTIVNQCRNSGNDEKNIYSVIIIPNV